MADKSRSSIWHNIFIMGFGTVLAQSINIIAQPILTRIVSAETLGIYTYILSIANIVIPIASLKVDMLIVSEKDDEQAQYITDASLVLNIFVSALLALIIFVGFQVSDNNIFNKYGYVIFWAPILVFTNGLRYLFISYNNRYKRYKLISKVAILREACRAVIQVGSGLLKGGVAGLSAGYAFSPLLGLGIQTKEYLRKLKARGFIGISKFKEIVTGVGKRQILYLFPAQLIGNFSLSMVTISITSLFSAETLGYYSAGVRITDIPAIFITANVNKVCYQRVSEGVTKKEPIFKQFLSVAAVLAVISCAGFSILYFIAPKFSEFIFGEGYAVAGEYIRRLCLMHAVGMVTASLSGMYTIFGKQSFELLLNVLLIIEAAAIYFICRMMSLDINAYLTMICIGNTVVNIIMLLGDFVLAYKYDKSLSETEA